jgi:ligand-binding sensor domain-containing protein
MSADSSMMSIRNGNASWLAKIAVSILLWFLFMQVVVVAPSFALDPQRAISQYRHTNWGTEEGLPQIAVQCIIQTRDGYLWLGTQEGLVRFDGVKFTVFDRANTQGINHNSVQALIQTADGSMWVGTQGGLTRMLDGRFIAYTKEDGLAGDNVFDLYEDTQKNLWIATNGGGLSMWKDGKFKNFTTKEGLTNNYTTCVTGGEDGTIYIGTNGGLNTYTDGVFSTYTTANGLINNDVRSVHVDSNGVLWVGTNAGLTQLKNRKWTTFTTKSGLANDRVRSILRDHDGNLWIGTNGGGLSRMWGTTISSYTTYDGLIDGYVSALCEDTEGNLWVGTVGGGLHRFQDGKFTVFGEKEGLGQDNVRAIYEARDGSVWIGADIRGITRFKNGSMKLYTSTRALANYGARGVCEGSDGSLWIGTYGGGLCRFKGGKFTTYTTKDGLTNNRVFCLFMAKDNTLWIGTRGGGISTFKNGKFGTLTMKEGLVNDVVRMILQTSDGSVWMCTDGGLSRFKDGKLTNYSTKDGLSYNIVYSLFEDENKTLWIGTYGGGLNRFKDGRFTVFTMKQGMYDNAVFQILEDKQDNFWFTCNRGIYRVSEKDLNDCADGKSQTVHSTVFGTADGLRTAKCNGSCQPAGIRARDGKLWFPTMKGVAIIDPAKIQKKTIPPLVFIERALFDQKDILIDSLVQLGPGYGDLEVHYSALCYTAPRRVNFKYMLVGFDKDWIDAGIRRVAYYTNVPPGSYTFKVVACNYEGVWNLKGTQLELKLAAHFYQTLWFYGLMLAALGGAGFGAYRLRVWRLLKREKELETRVDEALAQIKVLDGLIPICSNCKKIRDDKGFWNQMEKYIHEHSEATFSHGICPECEEKLYGSYLSTLKQRRKKDSSPSLPSDSSKE